MKFSSERMEAEYLSCAAASEVLKYLDEKGAAHKPSLLGPHCVSEALAERLFERNDRVVDIGLARVANHQMVSRILARRSSRVVFNVDPHRLGEPDSDLMVAALSNNAALSTLFSAAPWLLHWLPWIADKGDNDHLSALFGNPDAPHDVVDSALSRAGAFENLTQDRYTQILHHALRSKPVISEPEDTHDGPDLSGHRTTGCAWAVLLYQDPSDQGLSNVLADALPRLTGVKVSHETYETLGIASGGSNWKLAEPKFLQAVFARWKLVSEKARSTKRDWEPRRLVREITASKAGFYNEKVKALVIEHDDVYVRRGYYRGFRDETLDNLKKHYERDRAHFCEAAIENDFFYRRENRVASAWLLPLLAESSNRDDQWFDDLEWQFSNNLKHKHKADPAAYFGDTWEIQDSDAEEHNRPYDVAQGIGGVYAALQALRKEVVNLGQVKNWLVIALAVAAGFALAKL